MELRVYIQIILKNLQLIVIFTLVSLTLTLLFTTQQTPVFESVSTYVTRVSPGQGFDDTIYAIDTITGRQRIYVTFCDVMESGRIREDAFTRLGLDYNDPRYEDYVADCTVLPESNVMVLTIEGTEPQLVQSLNQMVGIAGMEYNNTLFGYVELNLLDNVWFNPDPISPNYLFNGVLGLALGVAVSVTIVFLLDYLRSPAERMAESSIYEVRLNVYNNRYASRRLGEEIQRSKMQNRLLAVALIDLHADENDYLQDSGIGDLLLRAAAMRIRDKLRPTDILAYRSGTTFILIMPETPERTALRLVRTIHENVAARPIEIEGAIANFTAITGMVENNGGMYDGENILELAENALRTARRAGLNTIEFVRTKPSPFMIDGTEVEYHQFNPAGEFQSVPVEDTEIPGIMDSPRGSAPAGEKTQPINFEVDDTDQVVPPRRTNQSVLDKIAQRNREKPPASSSAPSAGEDETRIGPFSVPSKKSPDDKDDFE